MKYCQLFLTRITRIRAPETLFFIR